MSDDVLDRLKEINIEDFIWLIYIGIIALSYISNYFERKYLINNNHMDKKKYQEIIILIFSILVVVYFYFLYDSYKSLKSIKPYDSFKKKNLVILAFLASVLITISGLIYLFIAITDNEIDVELAFN